MTRCISDLGPEDLRELLDEAWWNNRQGMRRPYRRVPRYVAVIAITHGQGDRMDFEDNAARVLLAWEEGDGECWDREMCGL
jgi:hypothetical protein